MLAENAKELLEYLAEGLVDDPEQVSVEQFEEDDGTVVLELCVGRDDYGKVIGRGGRTAQALRTVVESGGRRRGRPRARRHRRLSADARVAAAGRVGRPHGLDGSFYVDRARPRAARPLGATRDASAGATREIVRRAGTDAAPDPAPGRARGPRRRRGAAGRGADRRGRARCRRSGEGEWWAHELEGCDVLRRRARARRRSCALLALPSCEVLEVHRGDGGADAAGAAGARRDPQRRRRAARAHRRRPGASCGPRRADEDRRLHAVPGLVRVVLAPAPRRQRARRGLARSSWSTCASTRRSAAARSTTRRSAAAPAWCCAST